MNYDALVGQITALHGRTAGGAAAAVNQALLVRNWLMGAWIVEFEQHGTDRAAYGSGLLKRLANDLRASGLRGASPDVLERMRGFYRGYPQLGPAISALPSLSALPVPVAAISATVSRKSSDSESTLPPLPAEALFRLSWSHLVELLRLDEPWKRAFYENGFATLAGSVAPHQWQRSLASAGLWSQLIRIPTGMGKTLGVLAAWSWHRLHRADDAWPRRLVWCLPMRVLAEQAEAIVRDAFAPSSRISMAPPRSPTSAARKPTDVVGKVRSTGRGLEARLKSRRTRSFFNWARRARREHSTSLWKNQSS